MSNKKHEKHTNGKGPAVLEPKSQQPDIRIPEMSDCSAPNTAGPRDEPNPPLERLDATSLAFFLKAQETARIANAQMALFQQVVTEQYGLTDGDQITPEGLILRRSRSLELTTVPGGLG